MYAGLMISASAISDFREKAFIPTFLKIMLFFFSIFFLSFEKKQPFARSAPGSLPSLFKFSKTNLLGSVKQMFWFILIDFPNVSVHYFILFFPFWLPSPLSHPMPVFSANLFRFFIDTTYVFVSMSSICNINQLYITFVNQLSIGICINLKNRYESSRTFLMIQK